MQFPIPHAYAFLRSVGGARLKKPARRVDQRSVRTNGFSLSMLRLTVGILGVWGVWGLVDASTDKVFLSFRSFGLISPLVGLFCLVFSLFGLLQANQLGASKRHAVAAIILSVVIGLVPFFALPYDPS